MLIYEAEEFSTSINEYKQYDEKAMGRHHTLSEFWIFGAYEFLKTFDELCSENPSILTTLQNEEKKRLKHYFEHVRNPLAKWESAKRYQHTDYPGMKRDFLYLMELFGKFLTN